MWSTIPERNDLGTFSSLIPEMLRKTDKAQNKSLRMFNSSMGSYDSSMRSRKSNLAWLGSNMVDRHNVSKSSRLAEEGFYSGCKCATLGAEYTESTTLHGLKYVGDSGLHIFERLFWFGAFLFGILGAAYFISALYEKWTNSPMIVSLSSTPVALEAVPFPAITICNMNGARKSIAAPIMNTPKTDDYSLLEKKVINDLCKIVDDIKINATWATEQKILIKVSQPCHSMLVTCLWRSKIYNCGDIFNPELTDEGMCCSFNKVKREFIYSNPYVPLQLSKQISSLMNYTFLFEGYDWNPEKGFAPGIDINTIPWRTGSPGRSSGLTVVLDAQVDEYYCSSTFSNGFKVMLHNPVEAPKMSDLAFFLSPGFEYRVEVFPKIAQSAASLRNVKSEKRFCVFQAERELSLFRTYTQRNCQLECQSNFTLNQCGCVPFYLPKAAYNRICGTIDDDCVAEAKDEMDRAQLEQAVNSSSEEPALACKCLPGCDTIEYTKLMSSSKLEETLRRDKSALLGRRSPTYFKSNMAVAHFFFVERTFIGTEKGEIFGFTEFISSTGGLLGLFLGFSIMSVVEVLYFVSLRMLCAWWRRTNRNSSRIEDKHPLPFRS